MRDRIRQVPSPTVRQHHQKRPPSQRALPRAVERRRGSIPEAPRRRQRQIALVHRLPPVAQSIHPREQALDRPQEPFLCQSDGPASLPGHRCGAHSSHLAPRVVRQPRACLQVPQIPQPTRESSRHRQVDRLRSQSAPSVGSQSLPARKFSPQNSVAAERDQNWGLLKMWQSAQTSVRSCWRIRRH